MRRYWFTFTESSPLRNHVQPVLAKFQFEAKNAMLRFYSTWQACLENEPDHAGKHVFEMPLIVVKGSVIKVE